MRDAFPPGLVPAAGGAVVAQAAGEARRVGMDEARALLEQAADSTPAVACMVNGEMFTDIRDADDLMGPFLEVFTLNNYSWVPWEAVRSVAIALSRSMPRCRPMSCAR